ncbi:MAG: hypothetical protein ABH919_01850 [bacterium]
MKEKKQSKDWYIAATHWLTAGFAVPFLVRLLVTLPLAFVVKNSELLVVSIYAVELLAIWLGVMYSAGYINSTYIIKDSDNIVKIATIYIVVVAFLNLMISEISLINVVFLVTSIIIFNVASKKYIHNTESESVAESGISL